ncbi:MAG: FAD-binding oxidoreductase [Paludibacter sp.]|nr:FAD-binding oxidoreductase [Bacteroidales bacterium]MCM1069680.1 FAD-binding oxidoreductase [Prevotella sp.]MCM1354326.1 FAD-binding oxidoreductase [Bacteroides sp.]MCM1443135.1 FAD-binding oxidoreductase [Muribaculum sp.]MCM1482370.1 FAD-binding oxidoreductase [Paludibacter sp.]
MSNDFHSILQNSPLGAHQKGNRAFIQRLAWGTDAGFYRLIPQEVLHPATETDVQAIIRRAHTEGKHITFRAAGTSLSGQAISDSLLVVAGKKWEHYVVEDKGTQIRFQPGIVGQRLNEILRPYGRYFTPDPASIKSAMAGGIINNNASGMCCGTHANSYRMIDSVRIILSDGTLLDTGSESSKNAFRQLHPAFLQRIEELRLRTLANPKLTERIRQKYAIKNVTGLNILPFVEYADPFDIITRLIVGSEGTLAFLAEAVMRTAAIRPCTASALLLFPTTDAACRAVTAMKHTDIVAAAEFFDRKAMQVVENDFPELQGQPADAAAVLVKLEATTDNELQQYILQVENILKHYLPEHNGGYFTSDPALIAKYWAMRSGIFPAVGATRPIGTTCLIEDIAFPIDYLAEATTDLQQLFRRHNYPDAVIYGHALEGNYHFILNQRFSTPEDLAQYDGMMRDVVQLVIDKYHGSLKAEHGTGRNMAPFVRLEWGDDAYQLMCDVKQLFDPDNIFNPGVIFNEDTNSYIHNIKPLPETDPLIDRCIECGFCEVNCVACGFALSSRQRIVVQREISRLRAMGNNQAAQRLQKDFRLLGKDLCAGDGLCATSCPVGINVGEYIHQVRQQELSATARRLGETAATHFNGTGKMIGSVLSLAGFAQNILGNNLMQSVCKGLRYCSGNIMPLWTPAMPHRVTTRANKTQAYTQSQQSPCVVYFPSCLNQRMGLAKGDPSSQPTMGDMTELLRKAGFRVIFPEQMDKLCCGTIWESKGMPDIADSKAAELELALYRASNNGQYPVLCDQSPCLYRMRHTMQHLQLYEPAEFIEKYILERLNITPLDDTIMLHITCSMRKMGLQDTLLRIAQRCAKKVIVPEDIGCCAFAGDKGFTHPELNDWALRKLRPQVEQAKASVGISNSRTCEIGLSSHAGIPYMNIAWLVNRVSTPKNPQNG